MLRAMTEGYPEDWEFRLPFAIWGWRTTPQPSRGMMSPYRIVLGFNPRTPFSFSAAPAGRKHISAKNYADEIAEVYDQTVRFVRSWQQNVKEGRVVQQEKTRRTSMLSVGEFVLVLRPEFITDTHRPGAISKKLLHRTYDIVYQVYHKLNENSFIVKAAGTGEDPVGFANPVNINRLIRATTWQVKEPENVTEKRLEILQEDETTWRSATVCGYGYDTSIRIKYDGQDEENMVDLAKEQYRWII